MSQYPQHLALVKPLTATSRERDCVQSRSREVQVAVTVLLMPDAVGTVI